MCLPSGRLLLVGWMPSCATPHTASEPEAAALYASQKTEPSAKSASGEPRCFSFPSSSTLLKSLSVAFVVTLGGTHGLCPDAAL